MPYRPIWLDPAEGLFAIVDVDDYAWAMQWLWLPKPNSRGKKFYAYRKQRIGVVSASVWLHKEVLLRADPAGRTRRRKIGDHKDGESLNCRRRNLHWATILENNRNRK